MRDEVAHMLGVYTYEKKKKKKRHLKQGSLNQLIKHIVVDTQINHQNVTSLMREGKEKNEIGADVQDLNLINNGYVILLCWG